MDRRTFLTGSAATIVTIGTAGCAGYDLVDEDDYERQESRLEAYEQEVGDLEEYEEELEALEDEIVDLEAENENLQDQFDDLEIEHTTLESEYDTLDDELEELEADYQKLDETHSEALEEFETFEGETVEEWNELIEAEYVTWYGFALEMYEEAVDDYDAALADFEQDHFAAASRQWARAAGFYVSAGRLFEVIRDWTENNDDDNLSDIAADSMAHCYNMHEACAYYAVGVDQLNAGDQQAGEDSLEAGDEYYYSAQEYPVYSESGFESAL